MATMTGGGQRPCRAASGSGVCCFWFGQFRTSYALANQSQSSKVLHMVMHIHPVQATSGQPLVRLVVHSFKPVLITLCEPKPYAGLPEPGRVSNADPCRSLCCSLAGWGWVGSGGRAMGRAWLWGERMTSGGRGKLACRIRFVGLVCMADRWRELTCVNSSTGSLVWATTNIVPLLMYSTNKKGEQSIAGLLPMLVTRSVYSK